MFRKTITRLAFSPALAGELTVYARKLRREQAKRQIGLIFIALAIIIQSFAVLFPPESANAGNPTDFIDGGFSTTHEYLKYYDQNTRGIKDLLTSLGISRADIQASHAANLGTATDLLAWKMTSRGDEGDTAYTFLKSDGTAKTVYYYPLRVPSVSSSPTETAYVGSSSSAGWFAILKSSGNLVTKAVSSGACAPDPSFPAVVPIPVSFSDIKRCGINLAPTLSAYNLPAGIPATSRAAQASDRILYTLAVTNKDKRAVSIPLDIGLIDILEYGQLIDKGGGDFDQKTQTLTWVAAIPPGTSLTRNFIIKLLPIIPSTATGQANVSSYDCVMSGSFGDTVRIPVACPFPKAIEKLANELPPASINVNLIFAVTIAIVATYFYVRSRQLRTELRLIRHNYQGSL